MVKPRVRTAVRLAALGAALLSLTLTPGAARADAISPPPTDCPDGTTGASCHGGQYCQAATCQSDADCTGGKVCEARSFCVGQISCGGLLPPDATPPMSPTAGSACAGTADCDGGATCASQKVCVSNSPTVVQGCSCEAAGGGGGPMMLSVATLVAWSAGVLARARRRRQRAAAQRRA